MNNNITVYEPALAYKIKLALANTSNLSSVDLYELLVNRYESLVV